MPIRRLLSGLFFYLAVCLVNAQIYDTRLFSISDGLPSNLITCIEQDTHGLLWFGTWRGLCCYDGYNFISFNNSGDPDQRPLCSRIAYIKIAPDGIIWCLTYDRRAYAFDPVKCEWTDVTSILEDKFKTHFFVRNIYPLDSGVVWLTCYNEDKYTFRISDVNNIAGATNEYGNMDSSRNKEEKKHWERNKHDKPDISHIPGYEKMRKYFVDSQKNIWAFDHRLYRITPLNMQFSITEYDEGRYTRTIPFIPDIEGHQPYSSIVDSRGRLWVGTHSGGLYMKDKNSGSFRHFSHDDGDPYSLMGNNVFSIFEDSRGNIWVGCYDEGFNLVKEDGDKISFLNTSNVLKTFPGTQFLKVRHITENDKGVIFLSTAGGLVCFSNKFDNPSEIDYHTYTQNRDSKESLPGANVMQALQTRKGEIYVSTMMGGLSRIKSGDPLRDNLVFEEVQTTLTTDGIVLSFIEDADGCLWLARENYLEMYNPETDEKMIFGRKDFNRDITFSEALPRLDQDSGLITFGIEGGTLSFLPKQLVKSNFSPKILFSYVQYQGDREVKPLIYTECLDIPADKRNLTIYFSALDYQDNSLVEYAYKLVDDDYDVRTDDGKDWNYVGNSRCASFNALPPGKLKLLVKSTNADGIWTDNISALHIISHPSFGETVWAKILYILLIACVVAGVIYVISMRNRHKREREEMERKLQQFLVEIDNTSSENKKGSFVLPEIKIDSNEKKMMETLMDYINKNIHDSNLKIGDLADVVNLSRSVFYDRIKSLTDMSPNDFLRFLRIQRAKQLLGSTDLSISQIAYETGFSEPAYFGKVFKKVAGMSPLSYRKSVK